MLWQFGPKNYREAESFIWLSTAGNYQKWNGLAQQFLGFFKKKLIRVIAVNWHISKNLDYWTTIDIYIIVAIDYRHLFLGRRTLIRTFKVDTIFGIEKLSMNLPAASCRVSKLILFYPLTLTLSPGRGNIMGWPCSKLQGISELNIITKKYSY